MRERVLILFTREIGRQSYKHKHTHTFPAGSKKTWSLSSNSRRLRELGY